MSIIAAGTTTTTALSSTGNTDGTLQLQVNGTTPSVTLNTLGAVGVGSTPNFGTAGQALVSGGSTAAPTWASVTTSPAGSNTQIQYNNSGSFGASSGLTFDGTNFATTGTGTFVSATATAIGLTVKGRSTDNISKIAFTSNAGSTEYGSILASASELRLNNAASDLLTFYSNNSEQMRLSLTSTGTNLLVGTTSSTFSAATRGVIEVAGSATSLVSLKGGSALAYIFNDGGNLNIQNNSAGVLQLSNNSAVRLQIGSAGQLGIGGATYGTSGQVLTSGGSGAAPSWATPAAPAAGKFLGSGTVSSSAGITLSWATTGVKRIQVVVSNGTNSSNGEVYVQVGWTSSVSSSTAYVLRNTRISGTSISNNAQTAASQWNITRGGVISSGWNAEFEVQLGGDNLPYIIGKLQQFASNYDLQFTSGQFTGTWSVAEFQSVRVWWDSGTAGRVTVIGFTE